MTDIVLHQISKTWGTTTVVSERAASIRWWL